MLTKEDMVDLCKLYIWVAVVCIALYTPLLLVGCGDEGSTTTNVTVSQNCIQERSECITSGEMSPAMCEVQFDQCNAEVNAGNDTETNTETDNSR